MKVAGLDFEEQVISLDDLDFKSTRPEGLAGREGAGADRRRRAGVGIAGDPGASRRKLPGCGLVAGRTTGAGAGAGSRLGNARGLRAAAQRVPDELLAAPSSRGR